MSRPIFRKEALEQLASPEQLDTLLQVTHPRSWLALLAVGLLLGAAVAWSFLGRLPTKVHGPGILVRAGGILDVAAPASGRLAELRVAVGAAVEAGQVVAVLDQPQLAEERAQAREVLRELEQRHELLTGFGTRDLRLGHEALSQERATWSHSAQIARERRGWLQERLSTQEDLLARGLITKQAVVATRQAIAEARQDAARAQDALKQLELRESELAQKEREERLQREMEIDEQRRRIRTLEEGLALASQVVSPHAGRVIEVRTAVGRYVDRGTPLFNLERGGGEAPTLEVLAYLSPLDGKKVRGGMRLEVAPSTVKPEEYGRMLGVVTDVAEFPATRQALVADLANDDLAAAFLAQTGGAPVAVRAALSRSADGPSGYRWTSASGPPIEIHAGTLCTVSVTVREQRPIELVVPMVKDALGI